MVRYAFPHMHAANCAWAIDAPDVKAAGLDGSNHFHLRERTGAKTSGRRLLQLYLTALPAHVGDVVKNL